MPTLRYQSGCEQQQPVLCKKTRDSCSCGPTQALPGDLPELHRWRCSRSSCSHYVVPTAGLPGGLLQLPRRRSTHLSCSHSVAPTAGLPGGPLKLRLSTSIHSICSYCAVPTAGLSGGLLQLPRHRCPHPNCSHSVAPTAGLPGGPLWLRMSMCPDSSDSHSGAAIAATSGGFQQLLQHTTFQARSDQLFPMHRHARSDQLGARPPAAPAGPPVQQLGGACREGVCQYLLAGLVAPCDIKAELDETSLVGGVQSIHVELPWLLFQDPQTGFRCLRHITLGLPRQGAPQCDMSGRTTSNNLRAAAD